MRNFFKRKLGRTKSGFTLVELLVVIAIIAVLASIVLASLNTARRKSRDARRVADIKQIQLALELYFDSNKAYPTAIYTGSTIATTGCGNSPCIPVVPTDPLNGNYNYCQESTTSYHLGASLEESTNPALSSDRDLVDASCASGGQVINGADAGKCLSSDQGSYCYDITN